MKTPLPILILLIISVLQSCHKKGCTNPSSPNYSESAIKDDGSCEPEIIICFDSLLPNEHSGIIASDETWYTDEIHVLIGKVFVPSGVTLTIEPGTIIKAYEGSGSLLSVLCVEPGGKILAVGTAQHPIIFTTILDNIELGQLSGTNLDETETGLWGGIIILGNAPISALDGDDFTQIPGLPSGNGLYYGGSNSSDDSGILHYVSIRHAGGLLGAGNELSGLTLAGVGSSTQIDFIETVACQDDGIEIFGGAVNMSNAAIGFSQDDGIETSQNFDGSITNALVVCDDNSDKGIDMRGPRGLTHINGYVEISNVSIQHFQAGITNSQFKGELKASLNNINFGGDIRMTASYENDCVTPLPNALNSLIGSNPLLSFVNCQREILNLANTSIDSGGSMCSIPSADQSSAELAFPSTSAIGADISVFENWTWLSVNGKL